jgi:hypothetical protein
MARMQNAPARRRAGRALAWLAAAALLAALAAPAAAEDLVIDNLAFKSLDGDAFAIARLDFVNTNLTRDEIIRLLTPDSPADDDRALAQKFEADRISIPSVDILGADGSKIHLAGLTADHVDAGRIDSLDLAGFDAAGTDKDGPLTIKCGALHIDGLDVAPLLAGDGDRARPARLGGLTLAGLEVVGPDPGEAPGQSIHIAIGSIALHDDYAGDAIKRGKMKIAAAVVEPSPGSEAGKGLASLGYSKVELTIALDAEYQADAKTLALENLSIDGVGMGSLALDANFADVAPSLFGADGGERMQALFDAGVASFALKLANAGLFDKALAYYAKELGLSPDKLREQWSALVGRTATTTLGGGPASLALAAELQKFIARPNTLTLSLKAKGGPLKASDIFAAGDPSEIAAKLDISAAADR